MTTILNQIDCISREIRNIKIYPNYAVRFINHKNELSEGYQPLFSFENIITEDYRQSIKTLQQRSNYYYSIDISFGVYLTEVQSDTLQYLLQSLNSKRFAVQLVTNTATTLIGNVYEPLRIEVHNHTKNDEQGRDKYEIVIKGEVTNV